MFVQVLKVLVMIVLVMGVLVMIVTSWATGPTCPTWSYSTWATTLIALQQSQSTSSTQKTEIINYNHHQKEKYSLILIIVRPCHRNLITRLLRSVGILTSTPVLLFTHSRGTSLLCIFSSYW